MWSKVVEKNIEFVKIHENDTGTKVYVGQAKCSGSAGEPYTVKVRVTTVNGRITLLEDNGTEITADTDYSFWYGYSVMEQEGMPLKLKGKTLEEVINSKIVLGSDESLKIDGVSGATLSSNAVKNATINALRSKPISEGKGDVAPPFIEWQNFVVPNKKNNKISVVVKGEENSTIRYTLDGNNPNELSPQISDIGIFKDKKGVEINANPTENPDGNIINLKIASFKDGKSSEVITVPCVFANPNKNNSYKRGTFKGEYNGIKVTVDIDSPNFDNNYYIRNIKLDDESEIKYREFLKDLKSKIYLAQGVDGLFEIQGHETESKDIMKAIKNAIGNALVAKEPVITITPEKSNYGNDESVKLTLKSNTENAEIYYTVDNSNDLSSGTLSDPTKNGKKYDDELTLNIKNEKGGNLYIRAAAKIDENNWSQIVRKDLTFIKAVKENAFLVNGKGYSTWKEAISAINSNGAEIELQDDVELKNEDILPEYSCTIKSVDGHKYKIKGGIMEAKADITFDNVIYDINRIYGNGHSIHIGKDVETAFKFVSHSIFAGASNESINKDVTGNPEITIENGRFNVYGSGGAKTSLTGDVTINISGSSRVDVSGAYMQSKINGNISVNVDNDTELEGFLGEQKDGNVSGSIKLTITGTPKISGKIYKGSVNGSQKGTVDISKASLTESVKEKFDNFENTI